MNIQDEIQMALKEIEKKLAQNNNLSPGDLEVLLLTSLIEEEAQ